MKNYILVLILVLSANAFSQNKSKEIDTTFTIGNQKTIKYTDGSQSISIIKSISNTSTITSKRLFTSSEEEIAYLKGYISSLETKMDYVNKDPAEKKKAEESGWFDNMNKYISESKKRIEVLKLKTK